MEYKFKWKTKKQLGEGKRAQLDSDCLAHVMEFMGKKQEYYAARAKAQAEPHKYLSIIIDAMDKRKTRVPFFTNPPKSVQGDFSLNTKVIGAIIHGFGTMLFWCTNQLRHDTNKCCGEFC